MDLFIIYFIYLFLTAWRNCHVSFRHRKCFLWGILSCLCSFFLIAWSTLPPLRTANYSWPRSPPLDARISKSLQSSIQGLSESGPPRWGHTYSLALSHNLQAPWRKSPMHNRAPQSKGWMYKLSRRVGRPRAAALAERMLPLSRRNNAAHCVPAASVYFDLKEDLAGRQTMPGEGGGIWTRRRLFQGCGTFNECVSIIPEIRGGTCLSVTSRKGRKKRRKTTQLLL